MDKIAIIGFGIMGQAMARKILDAGLDLRAFDVNPRAIDSATAMGVRTVRSAGQAAAEADMVALLLPNPQAVAQCMTSGDGILSAARPGLVVVDMSTVEPEGTRRMSHLAARVGVDYLDAPILGRPSGVGRWALPIGGNPRALERCHKVLELVAAHLIPVGESGSGHVIKLLNQMMFNAINAMTAEMMAVADHMGVSRRLLYETIVKSGAGTVSNLFVELGRNVADENYENATFTVNLLCKDLDLAVAMAEGAGAIPLLGRMIQSMNSIAKAQGYGAKDTSVMWKTLAALWSAPDGRVDGNQARTNSPASLTQSNLTG